MRKQRFILICTFWQPSLDSETLAVLILDVTIPANMSIVYGGLMGRAGSVLSRMYLVSSSRCLRAVWMAGR